MKTTGQLTGKAYTSDAQYYEFLGASRQGVLYDWTIRAWVTCTIRSPKTPADAVTPADADAQLEPDPWEMEMEHSRTKAANAACRQKAADRHAIIQATLIAYLMEHGPSPSAELAKEMGIKHTTIRSHLSRRGGTVYVRLYAADRRRKLWGVAGVHKQEGVQSG